MLERSLGIRLILWVGKTVPRPAPSPLLESIDQIEVTTSDEEGDGFQIRFAMRKENGTEYNLLSGNTLATANRVMIGLLFGPVPTVLIDGIIIRRDMIPATSGESAVLSVTGKDLSLLLDFEQKQEFYPNQSDSTIVGQVLARYAHHGIVPNVTQTTDVPVITERIPRQNETDLQFIRRLAARNGYVFYLEPQSPGTSRAYWGPKLRTGLPQSALTVNMGSATNVESLSFSEDGLAPVGAEGSIIDPNSGQVLPIPSLPSLRTPPLVASPADPLRKELAADTAKKSVTSAAATLLAAAMNSPEAVRGTGTLDGIRYGNTLRARQLVGVRGVGQAFNGLYYVRSVTHTIRKGAYKQRFTIEREGLGTLTPTVKP